jgi:hypothetical protein
MPAGLILGLLSGFMKLATDFFALSANNSRHFGRVD